MVTTTVSSLPVGWPAKYNTLLGERSRLPGEIGRTSLTVRYQPPGSRDGPGWAGATVPLVGRTVRGKMTKLATRIDEIYWVEGFKIFVHCPVEGVIEPERHSVLSEYPYKNLLPGAKTVGDWKRLRFKPIYEEHLCEVFFGDTEVAGDDTSLEAVRGSYV